jgi:hypothetical protein
VEERKDYIPKKVSMTGTNIPVQELNKNIQCIDAYYRDGYIYILTKDLFYKSPVNKLEF